MLFEMLLGLFENGWRIRFKNPPIRIRDGIGMRPKWVVRVLEAPRVLP